MARRLVRKGEGMKKKPTKPAKPPKPKGDKGKKLAYGGGNGNGPPSRKA